MSEMIVKLNADRVKIKGCEYVRDLVRCRECKHNTCYKDEPYCGLHQIGMYANDFCSYGEKEE